MLNWFSYTVYRFAHRLYYVFAVQHLLRQARNPRGVQTNLLKRILRENQSSQLGRGFSFNVIEDVASYQARVGPSSYDDIQASMRRQESTGTQILCMDTFIHRRESIGFESGRGFAMTTNAISDDRHDVQLIAHAWLARYGIWRNKVFTILDDQPVAYANTGVTRGTSVGFIYHNLPNFMRKRCFVPSELAMTKHAEMRYLALGIVGLAEAKVSGLLVANPASLVYLLRVINENLDEIIDSIEKGNFPQSIQARLPTELKIVATPRRIARLRELAKLDRPLRFEDFWPRLRGVICWTAGCCRTSLRSLRSKLPKGMPILELGYQSSAFMGSFNLNTKKNVCLPFLHRTFYEFVKRGPWENGYSSVYLLDQLEVGQEYYVLVTTRSGLYRFATEQVIKVTGKVHATPTIEFVQQGERVVNLTGENLTESNIVDAIESLNEKQGCEITQFLMLYDENQKIYELFVESSGEWTTKEFRIWLDETLAQNNEHWQTSRLAARLKSPRIVRIRTGTIDAFRVQAVRNGYEDSLLVTPHLQSRQACKIDFAEAKI
ncbi:MAG: GH3 auxin-responsive promoter family protein [Gammaproteobacteria bacterium]|nr:GH3 auxin-responsive promoter family protein [Gammaproteobacteria bacterium]